MGAPIAIAVEALDATLKEAVNNSKIMNTLDKEISKALGLLVDLILLPFLPILVGGIVQLYMAVLAFGKWWDAAISKIKEKGLLGLLEVALDVLMLTSPFVWMLEFLRVMFMGTPEERKKQMELMIDVSKIIWGALEWFMKPLLSWAFKAGQDVRTQIDFTVSAILKKIDDLVTGILDFIFGTGGGKKVKEFVGFAIKLLDIINPISWIINIIKYMMGDKTDLKNSVDFVLNVIPKMDPKDKSFWDAIGFGSVFQAGYNITHRAEGGSVNRGQSYMVGEKGPEMFTPSSSGTISPNSGGNTFNFYGLTHEELPEKVRGILRQEGSRYTL